MKTCLEVPFLFYFVIIIGFSSCLVGDCVSGEGEIKTKEITVPKFEHFSSIGSVDVTLKSGPQKVMVTSYENVIDSVDVTVEDNTLIIDRRDGCYMNTETDVIVSVPALRSIEVNGSGDVEIKSLTGDGMHKIVSRGSGDIEFYDFMNIDKLKIIMEGSGDISGESGQVINELSLRSAGSGDLEVSDYAFKNANINLAGSGDAEVQVTNKLNVTLTGSGDVEVSGNPTITQETTGSGEVKVNKS